MFLSLSRLDGDLQWERWTRAETSALETQAICPSYYRSLRTGIRNSTFLPFHERGRERERERDSATFAPVAFFVCFPLLRSPFSPSIYECRCVNNSTIIDYCASNLDTLGLAFLEMQKTFCVSFKFTTRYFRKTIIIIIIRLCNKFENSIIESSDREIRREERLTPKTSPLPSPAVERRRKIHRWPRLSLDMTPW